MAHDDRLVAQRDARRRARLLQVQELRHRAARLEADRRAPVWIPPDGTPAKDLLTRKVLDRNVGPVTLVNTDVMGPGYESAYGLVMGIHVDPKRGDFDNQIRTHGSVDYTSIARRFSHGCHRLVNNRAVRLYDFVLRHRAFKRIGNVPLNLKKRLEVDGEVYRYALKTRGYYYELADPVPVNVLEGRIMGEVKKPITAYVRKPGVDYAAGAGRGRRGRLRPPSASPGGESAPGDRVPELGAPAMIRAGLSALALIATSGRSRPRARAPTCDGAPGAGGGARPDARSGRARASAGHAACGWSTRRAGRSPSRAAVALPQSPGHASQGARRRQLPLALPGVRFSPAGMTDRRTRAPTACRRRSARRHARRRAHASRASRSRCRCAPGAAVAIDVDFDDHGAAPLRRLRLRRAPLPADGRLLPDARAQLGPAAWICAARAGPRRARARHAARAAGRWRWW